MSETLSHAPGPACGSVESNSTQASSAPSTRSLPCTTIQLSPRRSPSVSRGRKRTRVPGRMVRVTPGGTATWPSTTTSPDHTVSSVSAASPVYSRVRGAEGGRTGESSRKEISTGGRAAGGGERKSSTPFSAPSSDTPSSSARAEGSPRTIPPQLPFPPAAPGAGRNATFPPGARMAPCTMISVPDRRKAGLVRVPSAGTTVTTVPGRRVSVTPAGTRRSSARVAGPERARSPARTPPRTAAFAPSAGTPRGRAAQAGRKSSAERAPAAASHRAGRLRRQVLVRVGKGDGPDKAHPHVKEEDALAEEGEEDRH